MKPLPCLLLSCVLVCPVLAQDRAQPTVGELGEDAHKKTKSLNRQYLVYLPKEAKNKALPVLIYLHGSGGVGNQVRRLNGQVGPIWRGMQKHAKERCILVAPQCLKRGRDGGGWLPADLNVLLLHLKSTYRIDGSRVYLTGNSMGG